MTTGPMVRRWTGVGIIMVGCAGLAAMPGRATVAQPVAVGFIGDSITALYGVPEATVALLCAPGHPLSAVNRGVSGTDSADGLPAGRLLVPAERAFRATGVRVVHVMLGTNDSRRGVLRAPDAYGRNVQAIAAHLVHAGFVVVLSAPPYTVPGSYPERTRAGDALLRAYAPRLVALAYQQAPHVRQGAHGAYAYFARHPRQLGDGVHPAPAGVRALSRLWAGAPCLSAWTLPAARGTALEGVGLPASAVLLQGRGPRVLVSYHPACARPAQSAPLYARALPTRGWFTVPPLPPRGHTGARSAAATSRP